VGPGEHGGGGVLFEPAFASEPGEDGAAERFLEEGGVVCGGGDEPAVAGKAAIGRQHVQVRVPVGDRAEGLHAHDRAGGGVGVAERGLQVAAQGVEGDPAQAAEPAALI
jgi:hypothetical protein